MKIDTFLAELKRRNVYKVAVAYAVVAWLLIQVATQVFPFFELPNWAVQMVVLAMVIGFPIAVVCSWAFEMTPEGIKLERDVDHRVTRKTGRKLMALITVVAALAAGVTAFRFLHSERGNLERQPSLAAEIEANCFDCNERLRSRRWKKMSTTAAASFSISPSRQRGRGEGACLAAI